MVHDVADLDERRGQRRRTTSTDLLPPTAPPLEVLAGIAAGGAGRLAGPLAAAALRGGLGRLFRAEDASVPAAVAGEEGRLGADSAAWIVHGDVSMFVGGISALLLQALHPRAMAGVADHSDFRRDPFGRLRRTASFLGTTTFGSQAEAEAACALVRRVHVHVRGTTPDGRPYAADEPELLDWIHAAEVHSFAAAHRRFGADPLDAAGLDRYVADMAPVAAALGDTDPPRSWAGLDAHLERHRPQLAVGAQARTAWRFLDAPGLPLPARPAYRVLLQGGIACLPGWARELWGVRTPSAPDLAACRALVRGLGAVLGESPGLARARQRFGA